MIRIFNTVLTKKSASAFGRLRNIRYICLKFFTVIDLRLNNVRGHSGAPFFMRGPAARADTDKHNPYGLAGLRLWHLPEKHYLCETVNP